MTVGAGLLLVIYPLIDVIASLIDARSQHGSARRLLSGNAAVSVVAAVALSVAATGVVQFVTALRRRSQFGKQWPMLIAGGASVIAGVAYVFAAVGGDPKLGWLVLYTATGGVEFVIQAWLRGGPR